VICFEVSINGRTLCTAGVGEFGVLSAIVSWVHREPQSAIGESDNRATIDLEVGGLRNRRHFTWLTDQAISVGDQISIRIIESDNPDEATEIRSAGDPELARRNRYELYQMYKREFEIEDAEGRRIEPETAEQRRHLRRMLYEEYKQEFENE